MFSIKRGVGFGDIVIGADRDSVEKKMEIRYSELPEPYLSTGFLIHEYKSIGVLMTYLDNVLHHIGFIKPAVVSLEGVEINLGKTKKANLFGTSLNIENYESQEMLLYSDHHKVIFMFKTEKQKGKILGLEIISSTYIEHSKSQRKVIDKWMQSD